MVILSYFSIRMENSMQVQKLPVLLVTLTVVFFVTVLQANAAEPEKLIELRSTYIQELQGAKSLGDKEDVLEEYVRELTSLESYLRGNMESRASVNSVRKEIRKANKTITTVVQGDGSSLAPLIATVEKKKSTAKAPVVPPPPATKPVAAPAVKPVEKLPVIDKPVEPAKKNIAAEKPKEVTPKISTYESYKQKFEAVKVSPQVEAPSTKPKSPAAATATVPVVEKMKTTRKMEAVKKETKPVAEKVSTKDQLRTSSQKRVGKSVQAPRSTPKTMKKQVAAKNSPKPMELQFEPLTPKPAPVVKTPAPPKPVPVIPVKTEKKADVVKRAEKPAPAPKPKADLPKLTFKPAAPKPGSVVAPVKQDARKKPAVKKTAPVASVKPKPVPLKIKPIQKPKEPVQAKADRARAGNSQTSKSSRVYVVEAKGVAGSRSIRKNNIYTFDIKKSGKNATLTFYGAGQKTNDTYGKIWLVNPDLQPVEIGKWRESDFTITADKVSSFKDIQPNKVDISKYVTKPGTYKIDFDWTDFGKDPLIIFRVEMTIY